MNLTKIKKIFYIPREITSNDGISPDAKSNPFPNSEVRYDELDALNDMDSEAARDAAELIRKKNLNYQDPKWFKPLQDLETQFPLGKIDLTGPAPTKEFIEQQRLLTAAFDTTLQHPLPPKRQKGAGFLETKTMEKQLVHKPKTTLKFTSFVVRMRKIPQKALMFTTTTKTNFNVFVKNISSITWSDVAKKWSVFKKNMHYVVHRTKNRKRFD
jgi:hypothetical protein